jgi:hypothetical protein
MNINIEIAGANTNTNGNYLENTDNITRIKENLVLKNNFFSQNFTQINTSSILQFNNYIPTKTEGHTKINQINLESEIKVRNVVNNQDELTLMTRFKIFLRKISDSLAYILFINLLTFFGIFGNSIKFALISPNYDLIFEVFKIISVFFLLLDIMISVISKEFYLFSFNFWIETISSLSFLMEFDSISEHIQKSSFNLITNKVANKITFNILSILNAIL